MGKKTKVVIDINTIISGFGWKGNPHQIIKILEEGKIQILNLKQIKNIKIVSPKQFLELFKK